MPTVATRNKLIQQRNTLDAEIQEMAYELIHQNYPQFRIVATRNKLIQQRNTLDAEIQEMAYELIHQNYPQFSWKLIKKFDKIFELNSDFFVTKLQYKPLGEYQFQVEERDQNEFVELIKKLSAFNVSISGDVVYFDGPW